MYVEGLNYMHQNNYERSRTSFEQFVLSILVHTYIKKKKKKLNKYLY